MKIYRRFNRKLTEKVPWEKWKDHPQNPLVNPPTGNVIADPTVLIPEEAKDKMWHMFTCGSPYQYITHWIAEDGIHWEIKENYDWGGPFSPFLFKENGIYYLFYHQGKSREEIYIVSRNSKDLVHWSEEEVILRPDLSWEMVDLRPTVRNPCLVKTLSGEFRLYYSGGVKIIEDLGFDEPAYIGVAISDNILGPYKKRKDPLIKPDKNDPWRNIGAGAMKVYYLKEESIFVGFNNGIYRGRDNRSHSAIHLILSEDGYEWFDSPFNPILKPEKGWKKALVYQLDVKKVGDELLLYYNARDGWKEGIERIGLATCKVRK